MFERLRNMKLFIVLNFIGFKAIFASVTCNPENKIRYGKETRQDECERYAGCWESGYGCYFSDEKISGFRMMVGHCTNCLDREIIHDIGRKNCSRECLKRHNCHCFTYNSDSRVCYIKAGVCPRSNFAQNNNITYNRYASKNLYCSYADCADNDLSQAVVNVDICSYNCRSDSSCKMLINVSPMAEELGNFCVLKSAFCDITQSSKAHWFVSSCILGPLLPDWLTNHFSNRNAFLDNSTSTCKTIGSADNFSLKIPWPTVGDSNPNFKITIYGQNLQKCLRSDKELHANGIIVFVVEEFQNLPQFTGNFKACILLSGDDSTSCMYFCSCGFDYCESVHIRAFGLDDVNMSICHYEFSK